MEGVREYTSPTQNTVRLAIIAQEEIRLGILWLGEMCINVLSGYESVQNSFCFAGNPDTSDTTRFFSINIFLPAREGIAMLGFSE